MSKILISSYLFLVILVLGCTNFLMGKKSNSKNFTSTNDRVSDSGELSKCTYKNGFNDSINNQRPDDLCFIIKDQNYKRGFRNGSSFISKKGIKTSLERMLNEKQSNMNSIIKSGLAYGVSSETLDEKITEISELKKEMVLLDRQLSELQNDSINF